MSYFFHYVKVKNMENSDVNTYTPVLDYWNREYRN